MNEKRRKALEATRETLRDALRQLKEVYDAEDQAYENLGHRQMSQRGEDMASGLIALKKARGHIKAAAKLIKEAADGTA